MIEYIEFNRVKVLKINKWELIVKDEIKDKKNFYPQIENSKLNTVNRFLGYEFDHHDALADALACSNILINISSNSGSF
ncbi:DNA polymerase III subunit epsilon, partial [human gut metagenome]